MSALRLVSVGLRIGLITPKQQCSDRSSNGLQRLSEKSNLHYVQGACCAVLSC